MTKHQETTMNDRPNLRTTYRNRPASVPLMGATGIAGFLLVAVLGTALLFLSLWWFRWRVNAEAEIRQDGFNFQQSSEQQVLKLGADLAAIDVQLVEPSLTPERTAVLEAQRTAIATQLCPIGARLNNPSVEAARIIREEC